MTQRGTPAISQKLTVCVRGAWWVPTDKKASGSAVLLSTCHLWSYVALGRVSVAVTLIRKLISLFLLGAHACHSWRGTDRHNEPTKVWTSPKQSQARRLSIPTPFVKTTKDLTKALHIIAIYVDRDPSWLLGQSADAQWHLLIRKS